MLRPVDKPPLAPNLHCNRSHCLTTITITLNLGARTFINGFCNLAVPLSVNCQGRERVQGHRTGKAK